MSAVARRRLQTSQAGAARPTVRHAPETVQSVQSGQENDLAPETAHPDGNELAGLHTDDKNQFSALAQSAAVQFSGTREIDQISESSVRVKLSRGQVW